MPRCCALITHPHTDKPPVFVAVNSEDEAVGKKLAQEAAEEVYGKLHAEDPERHPASPDVQVFVGDTESPSG